MLIRGEFGDGYVLFGPVCLVDPCFLCMLSAIFRKDRDKPSNVDADKEEENNRDNYDGEEDDDDDNSKDDEDDDDATSTSVELYRLWRGWGK